MRVLSVFNAKGGTSKSTVSTEIFIGLTQRGYRCLLLDLDEQADSSFILGADSDLPTIYDVLMEQSNIDEAIQKVGENAEVIMGSDKMASIDLDLMDEKYPIDQLKRFLNKSKKDWDFVIIDLPPHSGIALFNALNITDDVIIPILPDMLSLKAIQSISHTISRLQETINPDLKIEGIVLSRYDSRPLISRSVRKSAESMAQKLNTKLLGTIRETAKVREAQAAGKSIQVYAPKNNAAIDYKNLVTEYLKGKE